MQTPEDKMGKSVYIIAEAGVNHNGSFETAVELINEAKSAGADAIKFQTFKAEDLITEKAEKADYQKTSETDSESQYEMIKKLELDIESHKKLMAHAEKKGIEFLSSPFDMQSIDTLDKLGLQTFKVPSGEVTNLPYLRKLASLKKKYIISTGMCNMTEIINCVKVFTDAGVSLKDICLLHVNTQYPTPFEDVNLKAMITIGETLGVRSGYSDHTLGIEVPIAAAALGASVIEKHFTLDKKMKGPDHSSSLEPAELRAMVKAVRNIEKALGDGLKRPRYSEMQNLKVVRKSIVAKKPIAKGEKFTEENIAAKRPGTGISPMRWDEVIGKTASKNFEKDEMITI